MRRVTSQASVHCVGIDLGQWQEKTRHAREAASLRELRSGVLSRFSSRSHLLTQATIIAGVAVESDDHTVAIRHQNLVNSNYNAWKNEVLIKTYRTFCMAENYLEHCQRRKLAVGTILDAVPRFLRDVGAVYVDILVATSREFPTLCNWVQRDWLSTMSMGADVDYVQCSRCGEVSNTDHRLCTHLENGLGAPYFDINGNARVTAELCGHQSIPASNVFREASWVVTPAFVGARKRALLESGVPLSRLKNVIVIASDNIAATDEQVAAVGYEADAKLLALEDADSDSKAAPPKKPFITPHPYLPGRGTEEWMNEFPRSARQEVSF